MNQDKFRNRVNEVIGIKPKNWEVEEAIRLGKLHPERSSHPDGERIFSEFHIELYIKYLSR